MVASVSSLLTLLAKNARSIRCAVATLLLAPHDDDHCRGLDEGGSATQNPRQHCCSRCAATGAEEEGRLRLSGHDAAEAMACLGMAAGAPASECGGCDAMGVVEDVAWGAKEAAEEELREAFAVFDRDGDGFVSPAELWAVLRRLRMPEGARYQDCVRMLDAAAAGCGGGDGGRVGFREFKAMMENAV